MVCGRWCGIEEKAYAACGMWDFKGGVVRGTIWTVGINVVWHAAQETKCGKAVCGVVIGDCDCSVLSDCMEQSKLCKGFDLGL